VTTVAKWLSEKRGTEYIEYAAGQSLDSWLLDNPLGVVASEKAITAAGTEIPEPIRFFELQLLSFDDDPSAMQPCLEHMAAEEGIQPPFPPSLTRLPCTGNLRELRNRIARWRLFGQPTELDEANSGIELLEAEDIASNLHIMERILLHRALRRSYGNRAQAAKRLGVSRRQMYLLIERHGDPVRGDLAVADGPKRLTKNRA
jgi:hypothetical protein